MEVSYVLVSLSSTITCIHENYWHFCETHCHTVTMVLSLVK